MVKFRKRLPGGFAFNHISEYLGSHIYEMLGVRAHDVWLGTFRGEDVALLRDFVPRGAYFISYRDVAERYSEWAGKPVCYECRHILEVLGQLPMPGSRNKMMERFWDMHIIDVLLANNNRHSGSWGFLYTGDVWLPAPVFNNDSCLFPELSDRECKRIMESRERGERLIFSRPLLGRWCDGCSQALWRVIKKMDFHLLHLLIQSVGYMSDGRKTFIEWIIQERYKKLLLRPFERSL